MVSLQEFQQIRLNCAHALSGHYPRSPRTVLAQLVSEMDPSTLPDLYGNGAVIADFERMIADVLGKEAAVFMPSGTMAQPIALRIWSERKGNVRVAFHPTCHLELHEQQGYRELHDLRGIRVGSTNALFTLADLQRIAEPLGTLLIELPQREIGGWLPAWDDLTAIVEWARARDIALHLDGARLWQCQSFYQRSYAEIAALFDSVYVSFYKDLGGLAGAILAADAPFIAQARVWQRRQGGNLIHLYPYVLSAQQGMARHLDRIPLYVAQARTLAAAIANVPGLVVTPNPPHTNMFHLFAPVPQEAFEAALLAVSRESGVFLAGGTQTAMVPGYSRLEVTIGEAAMDLGPDQIAKLFRQVMARC